MRAEFNLDGTYSYDTLNHTPSVAARAAYFYVQRIGHFICSDNYFTRREGLKSFLLIITLKGKGYAKYRGKDYELNRNKLLLINCDDYHEYFADKNEFWEIRWMHFNGGGCEGYFNIIYENYGPVIELPHIENVEKNIDEIRRLIQDNDKQFEIKASEIIVRILTEILLSALVKSAGKTHNSDSLSMENVLEYIEQNHASDISIDDMAAVACSSKYHFIRLFKRQTGFSPYEYLIKYRINRSKSLLISTDLTIDEIAENIGFASTSNFVKTFRVLEEITPLKYRKYWRIGEVAALDDDIFK